MGRNKALIELDGIPVIERVIQAVPAEKKNIKIIAQAEEVYRFLGLTMIGDVYPDLGPIAGIHAGLLDSSSQFGFFLACDLPLISRNIIEMVLNRHTNQDVLGLRTEKGFEPLCTIYSKECIPLIESQIKKKDYSLQSLFTLVDSEFINIQSSESLFNLNTLQDWENIAKSGRTNR